MAVTLKDMSIAYIQSVRARIESTQAELNHLVQHLQECENVVEFNEPQAKLVTAPKQLDPNYQKVPNDQSNPFGSQENPMKNTETDRPTETDTLTVAETSLFRGANQN